MAFFIEFCGGGRLIINKGNKHGRSRPPMDSESLPSMQGERHKEEGGSKERITRNKKRVRERKVNKKDEMTKAVKNNTQSKKGGIKSLSRIQEVE